MTEIITYKSGDVIKYGIPKFTIGKGPLSYQFPQYNHGDIYVQPHLITVYYNNGICHRDNNLSAILLHNDPKLDKNGDFYFYKLKCINGCVSLT